MTLRNKAMSEHLKTHVNMPRRKLAALYLLTYATGILCVVLPGIRHISDAVTGGAMVAIYFPLGLFCLFGEPKHYAVIYGYVLYAVLASVGIVWRHRITYVIFVVFVILNIGGCYRGLSNAHM